MQDKRIEEALSIIWEMLEKDDFTDYKNKVHRLLPVSQVEKELIQKIDDYVYSELISSGYLMLAKERVQFTPAGEAMAKNLIRRQRLAERLLVDILERPRGEVDSDACEFEHFISPEVEESICTLLGHPRECPHGSPIPQGACCLLAPATVESIVVSLDKLAAGEQGKVAYILTREHPQLHRLMQFGIVPGTIVRVHQTYPSLVLQVEQTQLAMETEIATKIFIRRSKP